VPKLQRCAGENCQCPLPLENETESYPEHPAPSGSKGKAPEPLGREVAHKGWGWKTGDEVPSGPPIIPIPEPPQQRPEQQHPQEPRWSGRVPKPLIKPDNIYGSKTPIEIEKDISKQRDWKRIVGEESSRPQQGGIPGHSCQSPPEPLLEEEGSESEDEVEVSLDPSDNEDLLTVNRLCWEGGVAFQHFLVSKAIIPSIHVAHPDCKPETPRQPSSPKEWRAACERELEALEHRKVYDLTPCPKRCKVIKNHWVFDVKDDGRKRACLVAKGFRQVEGLDYDQVFSPVVRFETVHLILVMAALEDWVAYGPDVHNAYLYGELDEEIYMEQPEGFRVPGKEDFVLRLRRALYGLKQAGLAWWRALKQSMEELGFTSLTSDAGVFIYRSKDGSFVIAIVYVDDAIFCGPSIPLVQKMKEAFMKRWETWDLGEITEFLHMRITRVAGRFTLTKPPISSWCYSVVECRTPRLLSLLSWPGMYRSNQKKQQTRRDEVGSKP